MIERFLLPDGAMLSEVLIDGSGGGAFDGPHNLDERNDQLSSFVDQRSENQMHMIRHHHNNVEGVSDFVIMPAAGEGDIARAVRQSLAEPGDKCYEMRLEVFLEMRQVTTVEAHGRNDSVIETVGTRRKVGQKLSIVPKEQHVAADAFVRLRRIPEPVQPRAPDEFVRGYVFILGSTF